MSLNSRLCRLTVKITKDIGFVPHMIWCQNNLYVQLLMIQSQYLMHALSRSIFLFLSYNATANFYRLSAVNINSAALCLTNNPISPITVCITSNSFASLSSRNGPRQTNHKLRIVMFVVSMICPSESLVTLINPSFSNVPTNNFCNPLGGLVQGVTLGSSSPVLALNFGILCLGQSIILNSCGAEYTKLNICGMNSSNNVFEKCPRIPTTANTMPAK